MDGPTSSNVTHTLPPHNLAISLAALMVHLLVLTILIGVSTTCSATCLPQCALAWSRLALGWIGAIALMDWGIHWYFFKIIVSLICHDDIALKSFSAPPHPLLSLQFPASPQHPLIHVTPSTETLCPGVAPHLHEGELMPNYTYQDTPCQEMVGE